MDKVLKEYPLGDMVARYLLDEDQHVGLELYPADMPVPENRKKKAQLDGMVQLKLAGDTYNGAYAPGNTLRNGESVLRLHYQKQEVVQQEEKQTIITYLSDSRGYEVRHYLQWKTEAASFLMWNE